MRRRTYHFWLDERGHLYRIFNVEAFQAGKLPTGPAYLKEGKFLDFFFRNARKRDPAGGDGVDADPRLYPYVSYCGAEANAYAATPSPIVFHSLAPAASGSGDDLVYAGSLRHPFSPAALRVDDAGRIYHALWDKAPAEWGLLTSHLAVSLGGDLCADAPAISWRGARHPITPLPKP